MVKLPRVSKARRKDNPEAVMSIGDHLREADSIGLMLEGSVTIRSDDLWGNYLTRRSTHKNK